MKIETQHYKDVTVIELQGQLDKHISGRFRQVVTHNSCPARRGIVVDMSKINFIDSKGLEELLWAKDYCVKTGCQFRLAGLDENCRKILEITRLEVKFDQYGELAEAVKSLV